MDNLCPECGGQLGTSQIIVPVKKMGVFVYETQRRCTKCSKPVIVSESLRPPFPEEN